MPLFSREDEEKILSLIPPPELHLMLGVMNKIFEAVNKAWGNNKAHQWAQRNGIAKAEYYGGCLEGSQCRQVLFKAPLLCKELPWHLKQFALMLNSFNDVRDSCFGQILKPNCGDCIDRFKQNYQDLSLTITPKIHVVFDHVREFCTETGKSLGSYSEQASESVHADFKRTCSWYKQKQDHPKYPSQLLCAIAAYNSSHM